MTSLEHPGIRKVVQALTAAGLGESADGLRILTDEVRTAAQAAAALGVPVGAIANSLVFDADGAPLLVLTSGGHRADPAVLAELAGVARVGKATPEFVRTHTGQAIGGVAPVGHPEPVNTLVDAALRQYEVIWAAGGHPKSVFPIGYHDLVRLTAGTPAEVAATLRGAAR